MEIARLLFDIVKWVWPFRKQQRKRIIVVDDDESVAHAIAEQIRESGHSVSVSLTAEGGLTLLERNHIGIAFVDMNLPYMKGCDLIRLIERKSPQTLVVVICGDIGDVVKLSGVRFFGVMQKPFDKSTLDNILIRLKF